MAKKKLQEEQDAQLLEKTGQTTKKSKKPQKLPGNSDGLDELEGALGQERARDAEGSPKKKRKNKASAEELMAPEQTTDVDGNNELSATALIAAPAGAGSTKRNNKKQQP